MTDDGYKPDLELLDRYVGFSSEIVRVSLLGLAAIGFYLKEFAAPGAPPLSSGIAAAWFLMLIGAAGFLLAMAVACGLLHRYYATNGLASHIKYMRLSQGNAEPQDAEFAAKLRNRRYKLSGAWLLSSESAAACGVTVLGIALGVRFGVFGTIPRWTIALPLAVAVVAIAFMVTVRGWVRFIAHQRSHGVTGSIAAAS